MLITYADSPKASDSLSELDGVLGGTLYQHQHGVGASSLYKNKEGNFLTMTVCPNYQPCKQTLKLKIAMHNAYIGFAANGLGLGGRVNKSD